MSKFLQRTHSLYLPPFEEGSFWVVDLNEIQEDEVDEAKLFLDQETLYKTQRLIFEKDQWQAIVTHAVLRYYLGQFVKQEPHCLKIRRNCYGKPYLLNCSLHFNLSHTKDYALLGLHPHQSIGVDIENIHVSNDLLKSLENIFYPTEKALLRSLGEVKEAYISLWCAKEAFLKAKGTGFLVDSLPLFHDCIEHSNQQINYFTSDNQLVCVYKGKIQEHLLAVCLQTKGIK
jgi:4'-phosphopantetheinyl transferase